MERLTLETLSDAELGALACAMHFSTVAAAHLDLRADVFGDAVNQVWLEIKARGLGVAGAQRGLFSQRHQVPAQRAKDMVALFKNASDQLTLCGYPKAAFALASCLEHEFPFAAACGDRPHMAGVEYRGH